MTAFVKVLECMFFNVASTGDVGTAEAGSDGLGRTAVHAMPFLRAEDGMVLGKLQLCDVFARIHR